MESKIIDSEKKLAKIMISGSLDGNNIGTLTETVDALLEKGVNNIIFDCSELKFISSESIGKFVWVKDSLSEISGKLTVVCDYPRIVSIFSHTKLDQIVTIVPTMDEALALY